MPQPAAFCHQCGSALEPNDHFCSSCGTAITTASPPPKPPPTKKPQAKVPPRKKASGPPPPRPERAKAQPKKTTANNTSGQGKSSEIPPEIKKWNWGAFFLTWIWGVGNKTYIALLAIIPPVGLIMMFVLGAKGSQWAWQNSQWKSIEHFRRVQRKWAYIGLVLWVLSFLLMGASALVQH